MTLFVLDYTQATQLDYGSYDITWSYLLAQTCISVECSRVFGQYIKQDSGDLNTYIYIIRTDHTQGNTMSITKCDITEIKSLNNPPQLVKELLTVTLLLLGYPEKEAENYNICRRVLAAPGKDGLVQQIMKKDASSIPPDTVAKVRAKLQEYSVEKAMCVCSASAGLYTWAAKMTA